MSSEPVHGLYLPFNGTTLECDGAELLPDGRCPKCERINERIAATLKAVSVSEEEARGYKRGVGGASAIIAEAAERLDVLNAEAAEPMQAVLNKVRALLNGKE